MLASKLLIDSLDVSTRAKRRKALLLAVSLLEKIRTAEEGYLERIPFNLQSGDAYANAEYSVDLVTDAIITLVDAY